MTLYINNVITISMLAKGIERATMNVTRISAFDAAWHVIRAEADPCGSVVNAIGHVDTAAWAAASMAEQRVELPTAVRQSLALQHGDRVLVAQYMGPRLPEGTTQLPEGAELTWWYVEIDPLPSV